MNDETKDMPSALLKFDAGAGTGTALFSRYHVVDAQGDYTEPGFLPDRAVVPMLIGHVWTETPVGKGRIRSERDGAYYDFTLADTARGRELGEWLRFDFAGGPDQAKSEFSYGFVILKGGASYRMIDGQQRRVLHGRPEGPGAKVHEVSYVLAGAGLGTKLVSMKAEQRHRWDERYAALTEIVRLRAQVQGEELYERYLRRQDALAGLRRR